jgi:hypothetical protein
MPVRADKTRCSECGKPGEFYEKRGRCKKCHGNRTTEYARKRRRTPEGRAAFNNKWREMRTNPERRGYFILRDARHSDRRNGRQCDLTRQIVDELVTRECTYCGARHMLMTLDRIDNAIGHLVSNVVPACVRCNYLRRDMPYEAWLAIVPAVRSAHENGLFGDWIGGNSRKRNQAGPGTVLKTEECCSA